MLKTLLLITSVLALTACNTGRPHVDNYVNATIFGSGSLTGESFVRLNNGQIATCAGDSVMVFPATDNSTRNIMNITSNSAGGNITYSQIEQWARSGRRVNPVGPDQSAYVRTGRCNSQGRFSFTGLVSGAYYIVTTVKYGTGSTDGVIMIRRATVRSDSIANIVIVY